MEWLLGLIGFLERLIVKPLGLSVVAVIYLMVPWVGRNVDPNDYTPVIGYSSEAQSSRNTSAVARLFGEFRTSMSDIMFLKTERYIHSGVGYQPHITEKDLTGEESENSGKGSSTLIRSPENDWRGFVGDLERAVKPWMHPEFHMKHQKGVELLPWFRLMTLVNPHRIRGYRIGAFLLLSSGEEGAIQKAKQFIEEGIKNNPENHELQFMMVRIYQHMLMEFRKENPDSSEEQEKKVLLAALRHAQRGIEFGAKTRPPSGWRGKGRPNEMEDSFAALLHYEIFLLRRLGREEEAYDRVHYSIRNFGTDPVLEQERKELSDSLGKTSPS